MRVAAIGADTREIRGSNRRIPQPPRMPGMRYLITGGSGYIGTRLVELLSRREDTEKIVICDVVPPKGGYRPKTEFERVDVRDRGAVHSALQRANPDVLVHLAFILNPSHDEGFMYEVDVNGTHNVLEAAAEVGIGQVLVTTSAVAYGAFPDNPDPDHRGPPGPRCGRFSYARDKTESDRIVQLWALQHPDTITTIVRPCIVFGPNVDNYLLRLWTKQPFAVDAGNLDSHIQFVHEDDVVDAVSGLLIGRHPGQFNLAPDGLMTLRECAELLETPVRRMPLRLYRAIGKLLWRAAHVGGASRSDRLRALPLDRVEREGEVHTRLDPEAHVARDVRDHDAGTGQAAPGRPARSLPDGRGTQSYTRRLSRAVSSAGRAPARQAGGHWFEPSTAHSRSLTHSPAYGLTTRPAGLFGFMHRRNPDARLKVASGFQLGSINGRGVSRYSC